LAEFTCKNVWENKAPALYVTHDHNGDWQVLCGGDEHDEPDQCVVLHKEHLAERDPSLEHVFDLDVGWDAERDRPESPWQRFAEQEEDESPAR
jgi:hypothetical protein